jgi:hypothetical protein
VTMCIMIVPLIQFFTENSNELQPAYKNRLWTGHDKFNQWLQTVTLQP